MHIGQLNRRIDVEKQLAGFGQLGVFPESLLPDRVLQIRTLTVVVPMLPSLHSVHLVHVLLRGGIVQWHGRMVRIVGIKEPAAGIHVDVVVLGPPTWVDVSFGNHAVGVFVGLDAVLGLRTAGVAQRHATGDCQQSDPVEVGACVTAHCHASAAF
jgi:hypothetical protein